MASERRVLIIGADGLRPDRLDPRLMPTYARLIADGTTFSSFHSAFPSHTRVNMATLTTGTLPGRHGVINNVMFIAGMGDEGLIDTSQAAGLLEFERGGGEPLVLTPTLGDRLHQLGARLSVAASSSPGASLLWNLRHPLRVLNPGSHYGEADLLSLRDKLGAPEAERGRTRYQSTRWAARAMIDTQLRDDRNRVMTLWLTEPDASQHFYGLGSPEAEEALRVVDGCVGEVVEALERYRLADEVDLLLISDHGHSSVSAARSLSEHLADAREELGLGQGLRAVGDFIYSPGSEPSKRAGSALGSRNDAAGPEELASLVDWLQRQPWCGLILSSLPQLFDRPGVLPLELATGPLHHRRAPLLAICPTWSHRPNEFGVPGTVDTLTSYAPLRSTHGTASPYDMRAFCLGYGPGFESGRIVDTPCGTVDIAPTVWDLLGLACDGAGGSGRADAGSGRADAGFDGRSLLRTPQGDVAREPVASGGVGSVEVARVDGRSYFLGSATEDRG